MTAASPRPPDPEARFAREMARTRENFALAAIAGLAAMAVGAVAWAAITATTGYQIGFMAIGVGLAVGYAVRVAGKGLGVPFQILAAALALAGCAIGNLLTACVFYADAQQMALTRVLEELDTALAMQLMQRMFSPMDLLFYAIAVWEAWRLAVHAPEVGTTAPAGPVP